MVQVARWSTGMVQHSRTADVDRERFLTRRCIQRMLLRTLPPHGRKCVRRSTRRTSVTRSPINTKDFLGDFKLNTKPYTNNYKIPINIYEHSLCTSNRTLFRASPPSPSMSLCAAPSMYDSEESHFGRNSSKICCCFRRLSFILDFIPRPK